LNVAHFLNLRVVTLLVLMSHSVLFPVQIQQQKYYDAHCEKVHISGHGITHIRLWSSMLMQYIRTKQAEKKLSLHQYNFLVGSRKTVPLACRSENSIKIPTQSSRGLPSVVKATVRIFSSRTDLSQSLFPYCLLSPKDSIFRHQLCRNWKRHVLNSKPGHAVVTAL